jgi:molybdate transport system ATP-binding protein
MIRFKLHKALLSAHGEMELAVNIEIEPGQFLGITGPSGSGKTTLLRLIAGLSHPESGRIEYNGATWLDTEKNTNWSPQRRRVGLVFQDYALFPHMTVRENLEYPLERQQSTAIIEELIHIMEIEELTSRFPATLSGGQQQRVALARALVRRPNLLLLDEPLSALDAAMRTKLQDYILLVHKRFELTTLLVSHSEEEVTRMADWMIRLEQGQISEEGPPAEMLRQKEVERLKGRLIRAYQLKDATWYGEVQIGENILHLRLTERQARKLSPEAAVEVEWKDGKLGLVD